MDAAHTARRAEHGASSKNRNTISAAKVGAMAAATCMLLIAIKNRTADRRPGLQAGNFLKPYDLTASATLRTKMSADTHNEKESIINNTRHGLNAGGRYTTYTPPKQYKAKAGAQNVLSYTPNNT